MFSDGCVVVISKFPSMLSSKTKVKLFILLEDFICPTNGWSTRIKPLIGTEPVSTDSQALDTETSTTMFSGFVSANVIVKMNKIKDRDPRISIDITIELGAFIV
jgi:hypothetical protein